METCRVNMAAAVYVWRCRGLAGGRGDVLALEKSIEVGQFGTWRPEACQNLWRLPLSRARSAYNGIHQQLDPSYTAFTWQFFFQLIVFVWNR